MRRLENASDRRIFKSIIPDRHTHSQCLRGVTTKVDSSRTLGQVPYSVPSAGHPDACIARFHAIPVSNMYSLLPAPQYSAFCALHSALFTLPRPSAPIRNRLMTAGLLFVTTFSVCSVLALPISPR
jgi:hypothetical protein